MRLTEGSLFTGYNGLGMAVSDVFGTEPAWFSEIEPGPSKILAHHYPHIPNLGDLTAVDWDTVAPVDVISAGFPCQDVSLAGGRAGLRPGTRSGLWTHTAYIISKLRPRYVVAENVRGLLSATAHSDLEPCPWCLGDGPDQHALRALGAVLGDLAELGYDTRWCGLRAADVGAPHGRYRIFVLAADTQSERQQGGELAERVGAELPGASRDSGTAADSADVGHEWGGPARRRGPGPADSGRTAPDPDRAGLEGRDVRGSGRGERPARQSRLVDWGQFGPAIERWERTLGRVAPAPTEPGAKGGQRLAPVFVEWLMGLPAGHVTDVPGVNRNAQLKALGNGVVPQQATAALRYLRAL